MSKKIIKKINETEDFKLNSLTTKKKKNFFVKIYHMGLTST